MQDFNQERKVVFEEGSAQIRSDLSSATAQSRLIQWVIQYSRGTIATTRHAEYVLLALIGVVIAISAIILVRSLGGPARDDIDPATGQPAVPGKIEGQL